MLCRKVHCLGLDSANEKMRLQESLMACWKDVKKVLTQTAEMGTEMVT